MTTEETLGVKVSPFLERLLLRLAVPVILLLAAGRGHPVQPLPITSNLARFTAPKLQLKNSSNKMKSTKSLCKLKN